MNDQRPNLPGLLTSAQEALSHAVVYARETGGTWTEIAHALNLSDRQARTRYISAVETWANEVAQPQHLADQPESKTPNNATSPQETVAFLDGWCARHIERGSGAYHYGHLDGIVDRMVSNNLLTPDDHGQAP